MNNKLIIILLAILLVIPISFPISFAFELNSNELTRTVCQGNTILFTANVFGSGNFNVNLDGSASSWSTSVPQGFRLNEEGRTIYAYATPNHNVNQGNYNLNLIVSNQEETKTLPFTINVDNCHNLRITGETSKEICEGTITAYSYELTNLGDYKEDYQLSVEGRDFITLSQDLITLDPKESKDVYAYVNKNAESTSFTISAFNQYGTAEITSELKVNSCYDFTVSTDKDYVGFCEHSQESMFITVTNIGINSDTYNIEVKGPEWANLNQQTLVLNPQQSGSVNLVLSPDYGVKGNFDVDLIVKSKDRTYTKELKIQVNKCHDIYLEIQEKGVSLCNNIQTPLLIKNTGSFEKEFRLETSEQWASLDNYQVKLQSNEEASINLLLNVENVERGYYDIYVRALALDGSGLSMEDKINVRLLEDIQCHNTEIISDGKIKVTQGSSTTLPIIINNKGNEKLIYEISLTGEGSSFTQLNPSILELESNLGETIYLYSAPSVEVDYGDYKVEISVSYNNNILASKSIGIEVKESELTEKEYVPLVLKIKNLFKNLFPKKVSNETVEEPVEDVKDVKEGFSLKEFFNNLFSKKNVTEVEEEPKEEEPKEEEPKEEEPKEEVKEDTNKTSSLTGLKESIKSYWLYIIVAIVIIIILIVIFSAGEKEEEDWDDDDDEEIDMKEEKEEEDWDDDDEEGDSPLKIGRWIVGIIVVLALIYLQMNYSWIGNIGKYVLILWEYLILYKFYILIALILLLIIILIIKYWGSILEFFEEEEEKPKKRRKKK